MSPFCFCSNICDLPWAVSVWVFVCKPVVSVPIRGVCCLWGCSQGLGHSCSFENILNKSRSCYVMRDHSNSRFSSLSGFSFLFFFFFLYRLQRGWNLKAVIIKTFVHKLWHIFGKRGLLLLCDCSRTFLCWKENWPPEADEQCGAFRTPSCLLTFIYSLPTSILNRHALQTLDKEYEYGFFFFFWLNQKKKVINF